MQNEDQNHHYEKWIHFTNRFYTNSTMH